MRQRKIPVAVLAALLGSLLLAGPAAAHSRLVTSDPPSGARLVTAPASVVMHFSEGAQPQFSSFAVIDHARRHYETAAPPAYEPAKGQVTVALQSGLPAGAYVVEWKVVSKVDGHLTRGSFVFTVLGGPAPPTPAGGTSAPTPAAGAGTPVAPTPEPTVESTPPDQSGAGTQEAQAPGPADVLVRWLGFLLAAGVIGGAAFALLVLPAGLAGLRPAQPELRARFAGRFARLAAAATALLLSVLGAELLLEGARVTESSVFDVLATPATITGVLAGNFGFYLVMQALAALVILGLLLIGVIGHRLSPLLWAAVLVAGATYYLAETLSGHAAAASQSADAGILQVLAPYANVTHLLATAVWIGGIFYFVLVILPLSRPLGPEVRHPILRDSIARFSQVAVAAVAVLAVSGTINYLAERPSVESTLNTDYGREVLAKVALLCLLAIPAAYNLRRVGPGLQQLRGKIAPPLARLAGNFRRAIRAEAVLVSVVLIFSALLTLSAPAIGTPAVAGTATSAPEAAAPPSPTAVAAAATSTFAAEATPTEPVSTTLTLSQTVRGVDVALTTMHGDVDALAVSLRDAQGPIAACRLTPAPRADCTLSVKVTLTQLEDNTSDTVPADDAGGGQYQVQPAPYLTLDGTWQMVVTGRRYNQPDDIIAAFRYSITGTQMAGKVSDYVHVTADTDPAPPRSGPVALTFHLTDSEGRPVTDATVTIQGIMPTHGHVTDPYKVRHLSGGDYAGSLLLQMKGGWSVELTIARPGHDTVAAEVALDVQESPYDLTPYPSPNATPAGP